MTVAQWPTQTWVRLVDLQTTVACFLVLVLQSCHRHPGLWRPSCCRSMRFLGTGGSSATHRIGLEAGQNWPLSLHIAPWKSGYADALFVRSSFGANGDKLVVTGRGACVHVRPWKALKGARASLISLPRRLRSRQEPLHFRFLTM